MLLPHLSIKDELFYVQCLWHAGNSGHKAVYKINQASHYPGEKFPELYSGHKVTSQCYKTESKTASPMPVLSVPCTFTWQNVPLLIAAP